jgi:hypothetical protein
LVRPSIDGVPVDDFSLYKIDQLSAAPDDFGGLWNILAVRDVSIERRAFMPKSRMPASEYTMNIFYIIGVIVVVVFVAGFFGLHA